MVHRLLLGQSGQTLSFTPPTRQAADWVLEDMTVGEQQADRTLASGSIAAPSSSTPTTQESGPTTPYMDRVFAPVSARIGEMLRITSAETGASELVTVHGVRAGQYLTTFVPLTTWYPQASMVERLEVTTLAIPDEVVNDRDRVQHRKPMRVVWTLEDGSRHQEQVYLVRSDHGDIDVPGVMKKIHRLWPDISTRMEHHGKEVLEPIVSVLGDELLSDLRSRNIPAEDFLVGDAGQFALAYKTLMHLAAMGNRPGNQVGDEWDEHLENSYKAKFADLVSGRDGKDTQQTEPHDDTVPDEKPVRRHFGGL